MTSTFLYRFFDAGGRLLYVGISYHLERRLDAHRYGKPWDRIARVEIERFPSRELAAESEKLAIETERPEWNVVYAAPPTLPCDNCQKPLRTFLGWEGKRYCGACFGLLDLPPPIERPRIRNGAWWVSRQSIPGFRCDSCGAEFEDRPAVMRYVKERDYTTRPPTPGTHRWNWMRYGWCLWLEHEKCGWTEHWNYIDDEEVKRLDRVGGGWECLE